MFVLISPIQTKPVDSSQPVCIQWSTPVWPSHFEFYLLLIHHSQDWFRLLEYSNVFYSRWCYTQKRLKPPDINDLISGIVLCWLKSTETLFKNYVWMCARWLTKSFHSLVKSLGISVGVESALSLDGSSSSLGRGGDVNIHLFFSVSSLEFKTVALHYNLIDYCKAKKNK